MRFSTLFCFISLISFTVSCSHNDTKEEAITEENSDTLIVTANKRATRSEQRFMQERLARSISSPSFELPNRERYDNGEPNPVKLTAEEPVSTFSSDVDTASYTVTRRYIQRNNHMPPPQSIRIEEFLNYFDYQYKEPNSAIKPFKPTVWVTQTPWNPDTRLMQIGVKGYDKKPTEKPAANIVLLVDVSGSMQSDAKLPLVKKSFELMINEMDKNDTISMVVYAGAAGVVLEPTSASKKTRILEAINNLKAGGSTAGGQGIALAYQLAKENFSPDKINRIILASDGDFNVGTVDDETLEGFVARQRKSGIYLTILGFGEGNYNDRLAQKLAQAGNGVAAYIDNLNEARKVLVNELTSTLFPIAKDLKFQVEFNPAVVAEYRLIGYETRLLNEEDFNNDAVDAGDIGSGHTVTALYEIALIGSKGRLIDDRRYQTPTNTDSLTKDEYGFVKLRYKLPDEDKSTLISVAVKVDDSYDTPQNAPRDAQFAGAVAAFGQKLSNSKFAASMSYEDILSLASNNKGNDPYGYRAEFTQLVRAVADMPENKKRGKGFDD